MHSTTLRMESCSALSLFVSYRMTTLAFQTYGLSCLNLFHQPERCEAGWDQLPSRLVQTYWKMEAPRLRKKFFLQRYRLERHFFCLRSLQNAFRSSPRYP